MSEPINSATTQARRLNVPRVEIARFKTNFLKEVVCELRFPTLFDLSRKQVADIAGPIKKKLPLFGEGKEVALASAGDARNGEPVFDFVSRDRKTKFSIRPSRLLLSTTNYTDFDAFSELVQVCVNASWKLIDAGFFTRVGLRYVNAIPLPDKDLERWVNPDLVGPLVSGAYGQVSKFVQEVRGTAMRAGQYSFRHGIPGDPEAPASYVLDFDFFEENIEFNQLIPLITEFRRDAFDLFAWAAGPLAFAEMSGIPAGETSNR